MKNRKKKKKMNFPSRYNDSNNEGVQQTFLCS